MKDLIAVAHSISVLYFCVRFDLCVRSARVAAVFVTCGNGCLLMAQDLLKGSESGTWTHTDDNRSPRFVDLFGDWSMHKERQRKETG